MAAPDPDLAALAQESEPDYDKRVYTEYLAARKATGHPDEVSFENFIAKLKVNEGKLRAQYQCRAVRFRVVTKDGKAGADLRVERARRRVASRRRGRIPSPKHKNEIRRRGGRGERWAVGRHGARTAAPRSYPLRAT